MDRNDATWGGTIALILRDMEAEARLEFERVLGQWTQISEQSATDCEHDGDKQAAQRRLVKLKALREHIDRELESDRYWRAAFNDMFLRWR